MSKLGYGKRLPLFAILSAVVIVLGIVCYAMFGFNYERANVKKVEVEYDAIVTIAEKEEDLAKMCESAFEAQGLKIRSVQKSIRRDTTSIGETGDKLITYTFSGSSSDAALSKAADAIRNNSTSYGDADIDVVVEIAEDARFYEASWRGAIALAVAAIVVLVYVGFRFGVANALTGLVVAVHDALVTLALLAITRLPIFAYTPVLFAGMALVFSLILWIAQCVKMRENFKDPSYASLTAAEAVEASCGSSKKFVLLYFLPIAAVFVVIAALLTIASGTFPFPGLLPLAVSLYSSLLLGPAVLIPIKTKIDKAKASGKRYAAKKKANAEE